MSKISKDKLGWIQNIGTAFDLEKKSERGYKFDLEKQNDRRYKFDLEKQL